MTTGFTFKQFYVAHDRCAMKVGTDAILLGAWASVDGITRSLDIGAGSGVISLMLAQRGAGIHQIDAIDIDAEAVEQAGENFKNSPWSDRIQAVHFSLQEYQAEPYDLIVSNPPFFSPGQTLKTPARQQARHSGELPHQQLLSDASRLSHSDSSLALILPSDVAQILIEQAPAEGWFLAEQCSVVPKPDREPNRELLCFRRSTPEKVSRTKLIIRDKEGAYTPAFVELCKEFYLHM